MTDNSLVGKRLWNYPDFLSRAFYQDQSTRTFATASWSALADPHGLGSIIHPRMEQQFAGLHNVIVRDGETLGYERIDAEIASIATAALRQKGFDAGFVHFGEIDDASHIFGLAGDEYRDAIRRVDTHVKKVLSEVSRRSDELGEDWLVVITTDHGHLDEGGHGGTTDRERESWIITWSPHRELPEWPEEIAPHELAELMLVERRTLR